MADEGALRELIGQVRRGRLSRRAFVQMMVGLGLTAPLAAQMLAAAGRAPTPAKHPALPTHNPGRRGPSPPHPPPPPRHKGPGSPPLLLGAALLLRPRRQPRAYPGLGGAEPP